MLGQTSPMAEKRNRRMLELRGELTTLVNSFRQAQCDLGKLRAMGADEPSIRRVMVLMGFGGVGPDEFLAVRTGEQIARLVSKVRRRGLN
jgi:hypothetical protein